MGKSQKKKHPDLSLVEYVHEFDCYHLKTGDGHYVIKAYVELISTGTFFFFFFFFFSVNAIAQRMGWKS